ncbi:hypothetical protein SRHO_G00067680 [Serrasalmus rhombeus]
MDHLGVPEELLIYCMVLRKTSGRNLTSTASVQACRKKLQRIIFIISLSITVRVPSLLDILQPSVPQARATLIEFINGLKGLGQERPLRHRTAHHSSLSPDPVEKRNETPSHSMLLTLLRSLGLLQPGSVRCSSNLLGLVPWQHHVGPIRFLTKQLIQQGVGDLEWPLTLGPVLTWSWVIKISSLAFMKCWWRGMLRNERRTLQGVGRLQRAGQDRWTHSERPVDQDLQHNPALRWSSGNMQRPVRGR